MTKWKQLKNIYKGMILIIISATCFAFMNMFVHLSGDLPVFQKSFFRNFVALLLAAATLAKEKIPIKAEKNAVIPLLLRSLLGTIGILCNFYALDRLDLADASILNKMSPFFVIIFSIIILKEKIKIPQLICVMGALIGAMFVVKPSFSNTAAFPAFIALAGGMCAGFAYTMVRLLGMRGVKGPLIVAAFSGFSCLVTLPLMIIYFKPMTASQLLILVGAGVSAAGGQFTITAAYTYAPAREISVYDYTQIITAAALGLIIFGQIPDLLSWIGYAVIVSMAVLMFIYNKRAAHTD